MTSWQALIRSDLRAYMYRDDDIFDDNLFCQPARETAYDSSTSRGSEHFHALVAVTLSSAYSSAVRPSVDFLGRKATGVSGEGDNARVM